MVSRSSRILSVAALLAGPLACTPASQSASAAPPYPVTTSQTTATLPVPAAPDKPTRAPDAVESNHVVLIAHPKPYKLLDCATFDSPDAPHRQIPEQLHDATVFPERFGVPFDIVEILPNPLGPSGLEVLPVPAAQRPQLVGEPSTPTRGQVAFALGRGAFYAKDHKIEPTVYNARYCEQLNELISAKFLVLHMYPVYVDHGNHEDEPWSDLGTDAGKANAGFETLEEARAYAVTIVPEPKPTP